MAERLGGLEVPAATPNLHIVALRDQALVFESTVTAAFETKGNNDPRKAQGPTKAQQGPNKSNNGPTKATMAQ